MTPFMATHPPWFRWVHPLRVVPSKIDTRPGSLKPYELPPPLEEAPEEEPLLDDEPPPSSPPPLLLPLLPLLPLPLSSPPLEPLSSPPLEPPSSPPLDEPELLVLDPELVLLDVLPLELPELLLPLDVPLDDAVPELLPDPLEAPLDEAFTSRVGGGPPSSEHADDAPNIRSMVTTTECVPFMTPASSGNLPRGRHKQPRDRGRLGAISAPLRDLGAAPG
jgi:hypothetical protein